MLQLFRPKSRQIMDKKFENFSQQLVHAFAQIKTDIHEVNSKLDAQQSEFERMGQWISYLNRHGQRLSDSHTILSRKQDKIDENHKKLHSSHHETASRHTILAENIENRHREISGVISAHKSDLKNALNVTLEGHKELTKRELDSLKAWVSHISQGIDRQGQKSEALKQEVLNAQASWTDNNTALRELMSTLREENDALKGSLSQITENLQNTKKEIQEAQNSTDKAHSRLDDMKSEDKPQISPQMQPIQASFQMPVAHPPMQQTISTSQMLSQSGFERHIMSRVLPNRKGYVVKFILDLVGENRFSTKEIEEIIVKEKRLCGRTSFYAYLKELKYRGKINIATVEERAILVSTEKQQILPGAGQDAAPRPPDRSEELENPSQRDFDDMVDDFHSD